MIRNSLGRVYHYCQIMERVKFLIASKRRLKLNIIKNVLFVEDNARRRKIFNLRRHFKKTIN